MLLFPLKSATYAKLPEGSTAAEMGDGLAAGKNLNVAESAAQEALTRARNLGLFRLQLEALLAPGQIQMIGPNANAGRARLHAVEKSARAQGFEWIARKAAASNRAR